MPRALWSGSLSFGLVNVPVQLVTAARDLDFHFHQLHAKDKQRIEQRRFCKKEDIEVGWEEIGHAYDLDGKDVIVTDEELASVEPRKTRTIEIVSFAELAEVDPIYFDHPYFLVPAGEADGTIRAYRLLVDVMEKADRVAIGRFVMRTKEYLTAVRARDGALALSTMRFADEVRPTSQVPTGGKKPTKKQVDNAAAVIEELSVEWKPDRYTDCYRERLRKVIDKKRKGGKIEAPAAESEPKPAEDLMEALERTLANVKAGREPRAAEEKKKSGAKKSGAKKKAGAKKAKARS